ncbi:STAS domain-containing protein [Spirillospora sp. CA-255316]
MPPETGWHNYSAIREVLCEALTTSSVRGRAGLVVDFGDTVLLDAAGLVLLARTQTRAHLLGRELRVVAPPSALRTRHALEITGLAGLVEVHPDLASATSAPPSKAQRRRFGTGAAASASVSAHGPAGAGVTAAARVLDAIRALYPDDTRLSTYLPDAELTLTTVAADDDHVLVEVGGVLDDVTVSRLGEALTTMIEKNTHHLRVRMHDRIRVRCDPFPVLLGIRWRASAEGGCLSLVNLPPRLRQIVDREGLRSAFESCGLLAAAAPVLSPVP